DRQPERAPAPYHRFGIERLADARDETQAAQVVLADEIRADPHHHPNRGWGRVPYGYLLALHEPVPSFRVEFGFIDDAGDAVGERRDDPVRRAGDPSGIGRAPEDVVGMEVE